MARIVLTGELAQEFAAGQTELDLDAASVRQLVGELERRYPGMGNRINVEMAVAIDGEIYQDAFLEPIAPTARCSFYRRSGAAEATPFAIPNPNPNLQSGDRGAGSGSRLDTQSDCGGSEPHGDLERIADRVYHPGPVSRLLLSEQPHARVPRAVVALQHPAPVRGIWQEDPHRLAERTGQMRNRGVDRNHEIEVEMSAAVSAKSSTPDMGILEGPGERHELGPGIAHLQAVARHVFRSPQSL